jgi:hypothetical protein
MSKMGRKLLGRLWLLGTMPGLGLALLSSLVAPLGPSLLAQEKYVGIRRGSITLTIIREINGNRHHIGERRAP